MGVDLDGRMRTSGFPALNPDKATTLDDGLGGGTAGLSCTTTPTEPADSPTNLARFSNLSYVARNHRWRARAPPPPPKLRRIRPQGDAQREPVVAWWNGLADRMELEPATSCEFGRPGRGQTVGSLNVSYDVVLPGVPC